MQRLALIALALILMQGCIDDRKNCSDSFATVFFVQEDVQKLLKAREKEKEASKAIIEIQDQTNELFEYLGEYEANLFTTINLKKPDFYDFDWCLNLEHNDHYEILTRKLVGEPCELVQGPYTVRALYLKITDYNNQLDSILNTSTCAANPYFDWISNPTTENCITEDDRLFNVNLNNYIINILRIKEAVLNQELLIIEQTKILPN